MRIINIISKVHYVNHKSYIKGQLQESQILSETKQSKGFLIKSLETDIELE